MLLAEQEDATVCSGLHEVLQLLGNRIPLPVFPHSELMICLEHEKLVSHLSKCKVPSLTLSDLHFSTSRVSFCGSQIKIHMFPHS